MKSFIPIILVVIAIGLFFFQVNPLYSKVKELRAEAIQYDEALNMAEELKQIRVDLAHTLDTFSPTDIARLDHFLPRNLDTVRIIMDIDAVAARNGVRLIDLRVSDPVSPSAAPKAGSVPSGKGSFNTVDVAFTFSATYDLGIQFIEDLQRSLRLFDSTSLKVSPSPVSGLYDFSIGLQTYWINR